MRFEYALITTLGILVSGILIMIATAPNNVPIWEQIDEINQQAINAKETENDDKLESYRHQMQEKLQKTASDELEMPITSIYIDGISFPFVPADGFRDLELPDAPPICDITSNMKSHLQNIRRAELFQMFDKKYSGYDIDFIIQDERRNDSMVHYGFVAYSSDQNQTAMINFHGNSCNGDILDIDKHILSCRNNVKDEFMSTFNKDDILASFEYDEFCTIPLDPWRQSVYEYGKTVSAKMRQHHQKAENMDKSYESVMAFQEEMTKLGELNDLINSIVSGMIDDQVIQGKLNQYNDRFGSLPDEFLELMDDM